MSDFPQISVDKNLRIVRTNSLFNSFFANSTNSMAIIGCSIEKIFTAEELQRVRLLIEVAIQLNKQDSFVANIISANGSTVSAFIIVDASQLGVSETTIWVIPKNQSKTILPHEDMTETTRLMFLGRMLLKTTHDLNNMINIMGGYAECIKHLIEAEPNTANKALSHLNRIAEAADKSKHIIQDLFSIANGQSKESRPFNIHLTIHRMVNLVKGIADKNITINSSYEASDPLITCSESDIEDVIINLLTNAIDAIMDHGTISVTTSTVYIPQSGTFLVLSVKDNGVGMTEATKNSLFQPFFTTKGESHGTGLGLYGVKQTILAYGGSVEVISRPAMGTEFILRIPSTNQPNSFTADHFGTVTSKNLTDTVFSY